MALRVNYPVFSSDFYQRREFGVEPNCFFSVVSGEKRGRLDRIDNLFKNSFNLRMKNEFYMYHHKQVVQRYINSLRAASLVDAQFQANSTVIASTHPLPRSPSTLPINDLSRTPHSLEMISRIQLQAQYHLPPPRVLTWFATRRIGPALFNETRTKNTHRERHTERTKPDLTLARKLRGLTPVTLFEESPRVACASSTRMYGGGVEKATLSTRETHATRPVARWTHRILG